MKRYKNLTAGLTAFIFLFTSLNSAYSATSLLNKSCKKVGSKTISLGKNLTCVSVSGIKIWKLTPKSSQKQLAKALPSIVPSFSIKHENDKVYATMIVNGQDLKVAEVENAEAIIYAKADGNYYKIGTSNWKALAENYSAGNQTINFSWPLLGGYKGKELAVEIKYQNTLGFGDKALKAIIIPTVEPAPTASPTPTPSATPTPQPTQSTVPVPVTSAAPTVEVGCSVNYSSALPYASQRIAIIGMSWEKDSAGYVFANATMRNDNSMALRLVEFSLYILHKGSLIYTTSTLEGNHHFFIQGDAKFNSTDGASGAWLSGQVRTFKLPTNQMLECKSISVLSSGYTVKQGIGAS
jgi:hypothetical protein